MPIRWSQEIQNDEPSADLRSQHTSERPKTHTVAQRLPVLFQVLLQAKILPKSHLIPAAKPGCVGPAQRPATPRTLAEYADRICADRLSRGGCMGNSYLYRAPPAMVAGTTGDFAGVTSLLGEAF